MKKKYMAALLVATPKGMTYGNFDFETDEPLSAEHLYEVKRRYAEAVNTKGINLCTSENVTIISLIPLEA